MNSSSSEHHELIRAVLETLAQGEELLMLLTDDDYTRKVPIAFNASIGGHYRHCLDHFRSLMDAADTGALNYDRRARGTLIELDRFAALNATRELRESYDQLSPHSLSRVLNVTCKTSYAANRSQSSPSSLGREIMYSVAHAVHHYALISIICRMMGLNIAAGFGVAPSTLQHQAEDLKYAGSAQ